MPAQYIIDVEKRIVFSRGFGIVTDQDILGHASRLKRDPKFDPSFRQLIDASEITEVAVTPDGIVLLSGETNPFPADAVRAIFAPHDLVFGMARMFQLLHAEKNMLVTRSLEEAERHLGVLPDERTRWREAVKRAS